MNKKDLRHTLKNGKRAALMRRAKSLYRAMGMNPNAPGATVAHMISFVTGKRVTQKSAWVWLLNESGNFISQRRVKTKSVASSEFYASASWRALRFEALKANNGSCVLCGRTTREHGVVLHVDHIKPRSRFPDLALVLSNLQVLCEDCNMGKGNRDDTDWRTATDLDRALDAVDWRMQ